MDQNKKTERDNAIYDLTHGKAVYVMSFLVPLVIMIAIFVIRDIYPFGNNCYLRSDMYHQYCPFFSELWEKLRTGGKLTYSWDIGLGTNFLAIFGYYLSSPTNWFIALFPQKHMIEIMNAIILLKLSGSCLTCTIYLCKHNKMRHISAAVFGLFYGLSAFTAAYSWNLMWLDCVLLLPLIILGLERLVNEGKGLLYTITLGLAILSNYYIAIMICISMVIYFIVLLISRPVAKDPMEYVKSFFHFALYSLLAGGIAAILLLPEIYALEYTASGNVNFPSVMNRYFSFITIIKRQLINVKVSTGLDHLPNIYCGVAVLVLFPLFVMNKKIPRREKIAKVITLFIFFTAFNMNIPNFIWHGFHYPNSLPCRQSFIYIFLLLSMCYDAFIHIKDYKDSQIAGSFWGVMLFLIYIGNTLTDDDIDFRVLYVSAIFIAIYVLAMFIAKHKKINMNILMIVLFSISIVECTMNMENTGYSTTSRTYYLSDYDSVNKLTDDIKAKDDSFYRISKYRGYRSKNDAAWHNFHGASVFSSTAYASLTSFYNHVGLENSTNSYAINGATPLIYSMFDVKYLLSNKMIKGDDLLTYIDSVDGEYLYQNNYTLPLAYTVNSSFESTWDYDNTDPFQVQNSFIASTTDVNYVFEPISFQDDITTATYVTDKDMYLYIHCTNKSVEKLSVSIDGVNETFTGINHNRTVDLGFVPAGSTVFISDPDANGNSLQLLMYSLITDNFIKAYNELSNGGMNVVSYKDNYIKGTVSVSPDKDLLLTSIPYDEGYTVYVDGVKTSYTSYGEDAFIALQLAPGTHTIEFRFRPRGLTIGIILTVLCIIITGVLVFYRIMFKQELTEEGGIMLLLEKKSIKEHNNEETKTEVNESRGN